MTNQECAAEFTVVWNGSHTGGNEDLFRKPTAEEQKQSSVFKKGDPQYCRPKSMTLRQAQRRKADQKRRARLKLAKSYRPLLEWCA